MDLDLHHDYFGRIYVGASHTNFVVVRSGPTMKAPTVSDDDDATVTYTNATPAITVVKTANPTSVSEGGVGRRA